MYDSTVPKRVSNEIDYATYSKRGIVFGFVLIGAGILGHLILPPLVGPLPGWEQTLLFDSVVVGLVSELVSVFGFGIIFPLISS